MTITITEFGYLETPYLSEFPYLNPAREDALGIQFDVTSYVEKRKGIQLQQKIIEAALRGTEFEGFITQPKLLPTQFEGVVTKEKTKAVQHEQEIIFDGKIGLQWLGLIEDKVKQIAAQHLQNITKENILAWQMNIGQTQEKTLATEWLQRFYTDETFAIEFYSKLIKDHVASVQFEGLNTGGLVTRGLEFRASKVLPHKIAGDYLNDEPYLSEYQYLAPVYHVPMATQFDVFNTQQRVKGIGFEGKITKEKTKAIQFLGYITKDKPKAIQFFGFLTKEPKLGTEYEGKITKEKRKGIQTKGKMTKDGLRGVQFTSVYEKALATQFRAVLYNTTNLRVLLDFPSRGVTGQNWTSTSTAPSSSNSFSPYNLNTDIVEQYFRTETGVTSVTLTCDTELAQGVYNDTVGILNHNLSGSATIQMEASDDNFSTIPFATTIQNQPTNSYYISPKLPVNAYRYWRFIINDPGSSENFIRVGTIVFGSSIIFTNESFVDRVRFGKTQFVDKVYTEGFTNVSNDRGKKAFLELEFRNIAYGRKNFYNLDEIYRIAGVVLKCLWIPVPLQASRFAVFGKLAELPVEEHNYKGPDSDFVDYQIKVDESL